ncbi:MAG: minichromosome maintenance protein MCM, partial [Candidatus Syntropharchaeia archaeon]
YPDQRSLIVEFPDIDRKSSELAEELLENPDRALSEATAAIRKIEPISGKRLEKAHVRIIKIPQSSRIRIRNIRAHHINKFIAIEGLVRKATEVRPKIIKAAFECQKCGHITMIPQKEGKLREPMECGEGGEDGCKRRGPFKLLMEESTFIDAQKIRLQESPEELRGGEQPEVIDVDVEDDLSGMVVPGDRVIISGILRSRPRQTQFGKSTFFDVYLEGNAIEMEETEFEELKITKEDEKEIKRLKNDPDIYNKIIRSIAPSIYGYEEIKEAMALQLFSGVVKILPDGTRIRGDIHVLIVGDPGIAKSQLLSYVVKLAPRGIYTAGKSSTSAGLTATAVKDEFGDGRWTLEAGALVLADKGMAAVDEIDKMRKDDRDSLHEAMEQQTISVAKAGIMATLKSRCALLGAANPKYGRFDVNEPLAYQIDMPPTLLSRFDLIFTLMDKPSESHDRKIAEHIIRSHYVGELDARKKNIGDVPQKDISDIMAPIQPEIPPDLLRKYIAYSRRNIFPVMTEEARKRFVDFYVGLRKEGEDENAPVPTTARQLEALIRLGEASARMRLSDEVTIDDAERVISIVTSCLKQVGVDPETGRLDVDWLLASTTKTQRDRAKIIKNIVKELLYEYEDGVPREEVLKVAKEKGIDRDKAEEIIEKMTQQGDLYAPKRDLLKLP